MSKLNFREGLWCYPTWQLVSKLPKQRLDHATVAGLQKSSDAIPKGWLSVVPCQKERGTEVDISWLTAPLTAFTNNLDNGINHLIKSAHEKVGRTASMLHGSRIQTKLEKHWGTTVGHCFFIVTPNWLTLGEETALKSMGRQVNTMPIQGEHQTGMYEQDYYMCLSGYNSSNAAGTDKASDDITSSFRKYLSQISLKKIVNSLPHLSSLHIYKNLLQREKEQSVIVVQGGQDR